MDAKDIADYESLERWLKDRPREDAMCIAQRAALRVFPPWVGAMDGDWGRKDDLTALPLLRTSLTSGVARKYPTPEVGDAIAAAAAAAHAATAAAHAAAHAVHAAADAAATDAAAAALAAADAVTTDAFAFATLAVAFAATLAAARAGAVWSAIRFDTMALEGGDDPSATPLWPAPPPDWFTEADTRARAIWSRDPGSWEFWLRWWDGMLAGKPLDWDLQRDVALIPDEVWKQGPAAVAVEISRIEINHIVARTPGAEVIDRDAQGQFFATPVITLPPTVFQNARDKVADAVAEVRGRLGHNQIAAILDDLDRLDRYAQRYADNPLRMHDEFERLKARIDLLTKNGEISPHDLIGDLHAALDSGAIDIRRSDKEVAKVIKCRAAERLGRIRKERKPEVEKAIAQAQAESRADLRQELQEDLAKADGLAETEADKTEQENSSYRLVSRFSRMAKRRKDDLVKVADDAAKIDKGLQAADKVADAAANWWDTIRDFVTGIFF